MTDRVGTAGIVDLAGVSRMSPSAAEWATMMRGISRETLAQLGVASGMAVFPDLDRKSEALFFRYADGWKARAIPDKAFVAGGGFKLSFWNLQRVLRAQPDDVFIAEGEMDVCSLVEAGVSADCVLSVPNGAKQKPADDPKEQRGYAYVDDALRAGLNRARRIIWCGDADGSGYALRADMVQLFGAAKFWFVNWPDGCKDANDTLLKDGAEFVRDLVTNGALPWPVDGLFRISEIPEPAPLSLWRPGFDEWESKVMLAPRTLSVVTGHAGHGKTQMFAQIWFQVSLAYGLPICVATFETRAKPHYRRILRSLYSKKLERNMSAEEVAAADAWINERYLFVQHPDQRPTLEWLLDLAEVAVVRHGARVFQIDPWNRLEEQRGKDESKTDYIGRCLRTIHQFANDMNCHFQILAHPAKMSGDRRSTAPLLEDISDSKHWDNMVDQGFTVHRPNVFDGAERKTETILYHRKARFDELGYPCKLMLDFDLSLWRYKSIDYPM